MDRARVRVLALAVASLGLLVAAGFILDWFTISIGGGPLGMAGMGIDLRSVHGCVGDNCASQSFASAGGMYPMMSHGTLIAIVVLAGMVAFQAGALVVTGAASPSISRAGYWIGMGGVLAAIATAYVFDPSLPGGNAAGEVMGMMISIDVSRTWAPLLAIGGMCLGVYTLYACARPDGDELPPIRAVIVPRKAPPAVVEAPPLVRPPTPEPPPIEVSVVHPDVNYAVASVELSRAGLDARRADGSSRLVLWRDVGGIVVRRLPEELGGAPFADVVSLADSTLRILPWSRLSGDPVETSDDPDVRLRALVAYVREHAPAIKLDTMTRTFVETPGARPAQLPDASLLAEHDARFA